MTPRPLSHNDLAREAAVEMNKEALLDAIEEDVHIDSEEWAKIREQVVYAMAYEDDGYGIMKALDEREFWEGSSTLVELFDSILGDVYSAYLRQLEWWAAENEIVPKRKVGEKVRVQMFKGGDLTDGTIVQVDAATARYIINMPAKGHIQPGTGKTGTTGQFFNCEDIDVA